MFTRSPSSLSGSICLSYHPGHQSKFLTVISIEESYTAGQRNTGLTWDRRVALTRTSFDNRERLILLRNMKNYCDSLNRAKISAPRGSAPRTWRRSSWAGGCRPFCELSGRRERLREPFRLALRLGRVDMPRKIEHRPEAPSCQNLQQRRCLQRKSLETEDRQLLNSCSRLRGLRLPE